MNSTKGFSLTEVLMVIFTVAVIAAAIFPLNIIDHNQAERIAKWKNFYPQLTYAFNAMLSSEKNISEVYNKDFSLNPDTLFDNMTNYLNIDETATKNFTHSKHYQYFLNGKTIRKTSKYKADKFVVLDNKMIIAFKKSDAERKSKNEYLGMIFVDVNGATKRNFIGRDIFVVAMYPNRLEPIGLHSTRQEMKEDCSPVGSGLKCSAYYLVGGDF